MAYFAAMALFTAETARIAAIKSHAQTSARNRPAIQPEVSAVQSQPAEPSDSFTVRKLARVRGQIDAVEKLLDAATEPQAVDRFANALTRLYDLERILAGRPLPGSRRPPAERATSRRGGPVGIVDDQPTAPSVHTPATPPAPVQPARPLGWEYDDPNYASPQTP